MTEPEAWRRRPPVSCTLCRKRKIRCDRGTPCNNCLKSRNGICVYINTSAGQFQKDEPTKEPHQGHNANPIDGSSNSAMLVTSNLKANAGRNSNPTIVAEVSTIGSNSPSTNIVSSVSTPASNFSSINIANREVSMTSKLDGHIQEVEWMRGRIKQLEEQLKENQTPARHRTPIPTPKLVTELTSSLGGTFYMEDKSNLFGQCQVISGSIMHKSRLFGQSHWSNGLRLFLDILELMEPYVKEETSKALSGMQKCKYLGKLIKSKRVPPWPSPPSPDLPAKEITDKLINCYFRTTETIYRILHIPTFQRDYEATWHPGSEPAPAFLVQLKLVLAIGAITHDDHFSFRTLATKWVYEAHTWYSDPEFKSGLSIQSLQTSILLLLARELVGVGDKLIWISVGSLFRMAVYMGLNRDPEYLPKRSIFAAEMRRRLWNTILELTLQSSISSGGPPLIDLDDFNTVAPGNYDDNQLLAESPVPKPANEFTQTSIAIALHRTFSHRLAIVKFLNNVSAYNTYEKALQLDKELRMAYKTLCRTLQAYRLGLGRPPSQFELGVVEFIMQRYLSSLHIPFFAAALHETAYAYSRNLVIESSLKLWRLAYPSSFSNQHVNDISHPDLPLLAVCGAGFFRIVALQASFLIALELKTQVEEEESLGPVSLRPDLYPVLDDARKWNWRAIEIGETNIKGYLLMCLVAVPIEALMKGFEKGELPKLLANAAEEVMDKCLPVLEEVVGQSQVEGNIEFFNQMSLDMPLETEDWDLMISDAMFDLGTSEQMGWAIDRTSQAM